MILGKDYETWSIDVPEIKFQDQLNATVLLDPLHPENEYFVLVSDQRIRLKPGIEKQVLAGRGAFLPSGQYTIQVLLYSKVSGESRVTISFNIDADDSVIDQGSWLPQ